jgi:hypothetical protein
MMVEVCGSSEAVFEFAYRWDGTGTCKDMDCDVATLRLRIRTLEEINRELKERLKAACGRLAVVQTKLGSCTER